MIKDPASSAFLYIAHAGFFIGKKGDCFMNNKIGRTKMKREIEFRGKKTNRSKPENLDIFSGEPKKKDDWIYGSFATGMGGASYIMPSCYTSGLVVISEDEDEEGDVVTEYGTDVYLGGFVLVDHESVGQFTGLRDKNGTKIFEGDVLECDGEYNGEVKFNNGKFYVTNWFGSLFANENKAIIGNIFDNPELLKA